MYHIRILCSFLNKIRWNINNSCPISHRLRVTRNTYTNFIFGVRRELANCPEMRLEITRLTSVKNVLFDEHGQQIFVVMVDFSRPDTWLMTEYVSSMPFFQLVSNIGDTLGIWAGASIVSLIHALFRAVRGLVRKAKKARKASAETKPSVELEMSEITVTI